MCGSGHTRLLLDKLLDNASIPKVQSPISFRSWKQTDLLLNSWKVRLVPRSPCYSHGNICEQKVQIDTNPKFQNSSDPFSSFQSCIKTRLYLGLDAFFEYRNVFPTFYVCCIYKHRIRVGWCYRGLLVDSYFFDSSYYHKVRGFRFSGFAFITSTLSSLLFGLLFWFLCRFLSNVLCLKLVFSSWLALWSNGLSGAVGLRMS